MQSNAIRKDNSEYIRQAVEYLPVASYRGALEIYREIALDPNFDDQVLAEVAKHDRFCLLTQVLRRPDVLHPWLYERCREVERDPDERLDLWSRGHYKSTIITFAGSFQEIIKDPEVTICILSNVRPIAKGFLFQIKLECETNDLLPKLWPDIFWSAPRKQAPIWSLDDGLVMKRKGNPKEKTVEAAGLVDGQPISKHYKIRIYNDVVTDASVGSPQMILKTMERWELSQNLGTTEISEETKARRWHEGTRYSFMDAYGQILKRQALIPRIHPATDSGTLDGKPVFLTQDAWDRKRRDESPRMIACQQLLNPVAGEEQEFKPQWLRRWEIRPETLNVAICVDPASSKKKESCNTAMVVIGIDAAWNKYLLDGACHKMNLTDRWTMLKYLRTKWLRQPGIQVVQVAYEKYGMQSDIEHYETMMQIENKAFPIEEVSWPRERTEGAKDDRIRRLIPDHQNWRFFYPETLMALNPDTNQWEADFRPQATKLQAEALKQGKPWLIAQRIMRKDENNKLYNVVEKFINNEYLFFPATTWKDFFDAMSRIYDLEMRPPQKLREEDTLPEPDGD